MAQISSFPLVSTTARSGGLWQQIPPWIFRITRDISSKWSWFCLNCRISANQLMAGLATWMILLCYLIHLCNFLSGEYVSLWVSSGARGCGVDRGGFMCRCYCSEMRLILPSNGHSATQIQFTNLISLQGFCFNCRTALSPNGLECGSS